MKVVAVSTPETRTRSRPTSLFWSKQPFQYHRSKRVTGSSRPQHPKAQSPPSFEHPFSHLQLSKDGGAAR
ncbi:hypothetical protein K443DRAFT_686602 [Laccaria amethystina LaAM-08-1]|uniref:Uncharacterized protein n=1 Tax=Laccaria amethystina LaAM-08-1 TaxID=1095629 RepID=A0A0C9WLW8_9AGAR|nr:hypothetical protein K443DRAFT_686602 [Laccaria amethystina LaAM-08-1]